jgi:arylsulfatase A-like enzyme
MLPILPVGHVDLAQTFCAIAGIAPPVWVEGQPLPVSDDNARAQRRERVLTEWDSEHGPIDLHIRTICRDGYLCSRYAKGSLYDGTEGKLYHLTEDPAVLVNLWDDARRGALRLDLVADLYDHLAPHCAPRLTRGAPV